MRNLAGFAVIGFEEPSEVELTLTRWNPTPRSTSTLAIKLYRGFLQAWGTQHHCRSDPDHCHSSYTAYWEVSYSSYYHVSVSSQQESKQSLHFFLRRHTWTITTVEGHRLLRFRLLFWTQTWVTDHWTSDVLARVDVELKVTCCPDCCYSH